MFNEKKLYGSIFVFSLYSQSKTDLMNTILNFEKITKQKNNNTLKQFSPCKTKILK